MNVADAFDAMTTERPYRAGLTIEQAVDQMQQKAGTQFAAEVVEVLVRALQDGSIQLIRNPTVFDDSVRATTSFDRGQ